MPEDSPARRIRHAQETLAALARVEADRSAENIAALHMLHARHLRETGDIAGAMEAEARAARAQASGSSDEEL